MNSKTPLIFASGCLFVTAVAFIPICVQAQTQDQGDIIHVCSDQEGVLRMVPVAAACPQGQQSLLLQKWSPPEPPKPDDDNNGKPPSPADDSKLKDLEQRVKKLENSPDCGAPGKSRVVAPFEVVDRNGKRIFYVNDGVAELYNSAGKDVAWISASASGGNFLAQSSAGNLLTSFGASGQSAGMTVSEDGNPRLNIGRRPDLGTYRALFYSASGQAVAGIGQSQGAAGLAFVADSGGVIKARMTNSQDGKGRINISQTTDGTSIAELTEGEHGGGKLFICTPGGCDPPMVEAGDAGGYGIVRTGPMGFNPGVGLLGLPGSFIMGKK
jgi:hypothetical protein